MFSSKQLLSLSVLCTFLTLASAVPAPRSTCTGPTVVVKSGDTCNAIAGAVGIPVATLMANNPAINSGCTNLFPGQVLCITPNPPTCAGPTVVVKSGDTCNAIASAAGIPLATLMANNPAVNSGCTNLFPGQILCITPKTPTCTVTVVVKSGDTCNAIANAAGIPLATLMANNPAINSGCTNLFPGQVLCIAPKPTCTVTVVVKSGDTCNAIANAAGVPLATLMANNPAINSGCTNLFPGQVLCITPKPTCAGPTVVVKSGDTCNAIASAVGIPLATLMANNPAINSGCTNLFPGQVLCITGATKCQCSSTLVVISGDTCNAIASFVGIPLSTLLANNPAINSGCTNLSIGQVLCTDSRVLSTC
ncbi:hypothetical protein BC826DRAFT_712248 [Russula brevipes]|nr:hypothetical protein BC826DRAFT_712248 [Russula brevipes]